MNFFDKNASSKQMFIDAEKELTASLNNSFNKEYENMKKALLSEGVEPSKVNGILEQIKIDTKLEMIKRFKEKLRLGASQNSSTSAQQPQNIQQANTESAASVTIGSAPKASSSS